jgi:alpha-aminoadipic semialdehyde synthase
MFDIGIRREDKNRWERRTPLTPEHVAELVQEDGFSVAVQPSPLRIYPEEEYQDAGATVQEDLSDCRLVLGVKEVPPKLLLPKKPYMFFSHVIKGQAYNMPLLRRLLDLECTLMDYEMVVDHRGRRLIFFGRHAGYAGMVDALWALGQRMEIEDFDTAFAAVQPSHTYASVHEAAEFISTKVGRRIRQVGLNPALHPLVVGFTGGGNVSQGAQEILGRLPTVEVHPEDLPSLAEATQLSRKAVYKVVFRREHRENFSRHLPYLTVLVNGIYWEPSEPRLVTRADLRQLWDSSAQPRLRLLADISCDVEGSIEATVRATTPDDPVYVYDPATGQATSGVGGRGPIVLAIDNLPAEFPRDASEHFGDSLFPLLEKLVGADFNHDYAQLSLPQPVCSAVITHRGKLTPRYRHLEQALEKAGA